MPFKLANHGGRYLYVNDQNEIQEDRDYNLSLTPEQLAAKGSVFDVDSGNDGRLVSERGPVQFKPAHAGRPCNLEVKQLSPAEYVIKTATRRSNPQYVYSKLDALGLENKPGPMAVFTVVKQQEQQQNAQEQQAESGHRQAQHRRYSVEQQYELLQSYLHGQRLQ